MKKCPFCREEIQDEALVCKSCGRDLSGSAKIINKLRKFLIIALLCLGLLSLFLPIVHLQLPLFGKSSYSVISIIKQAIGSDEGQGLSLKDIKSISSSIKKNIPEEYEDKIDDQTAKLYTTVIKVSFIVLIVGYLSYILVIILGILGLRKPVNIFSLISCLGAVYSIVSLEVFNRVLQKMLCSIQADIADNPYAGIFTTLFCEFKIIPGDALYVLALVMGIVFLISFFWKPKRI